MGAKEHSPIILAVAAGVGVLSTVYLTNRAAFKACDAIRADEDIFGTEEFTRKERLIRRTKLVWKFYVPAGVATGSTILCIIGASKAEARKTIAAQTAFAVSQRMYSEYRDKVIEEYGANKDQSIRDKIADERVSESPPKEIIVAGSGSVLCCELYTGRYFNSDMESLRKAQNDINAMLLSQDYATFDDFYYIIGLSRTKTSNRTGWTSNRLMELQFSTVLAEDGRPCLAFDYNYETLL